MSQSSLLASLTFRFSAHPENLATEALLHILRYPSAGAEFGRIVNELAPECPTPRHYRSQAVSEDSIPDIVGMDAAGNESVVVENKFWAGLTDAQPCFYLDRLKDRASLVLFVVPSARINLVWAEVCRRCANAGIPAVPAQGRNDARIAKVRGGQVLALISWRALLARLLSTAQEAKDGKLSGDIAQLVGLCDEMDTQAFLPLRSEELTGDLPRRVVQLNELVDDLAGKLLSDEVASKKNLRASGSRGWYGHYLRIAGYGCLLQFNAYHWSKFGESPMWLRIKNDKWEAEGATSDYLRSALPETNVIHNEDEGTLVPIYLRSGVEYQHLFADAHAQLSRVVDLLTARPRKQSQDLPPPPESS